MWMIVPLLLSLWSQSLIVHSRGCFLTDWTTSFDKSGYSTCSSSYYLFMRGLWRSRLDDVNDDPIDNIEKASCCARAQVFSGQSSVCQIADWDDSMEREGWSLCPQGHFLVGLKRAYFSWLMNINYAKCCKPADHPYYYGNCYDEDVSVSFNKEGLSTCALGYFMVGLYRKKGSGELHDLEKFRCCKMYEDELPLTSLSEVKSRMVDRSLMYLAYVGYYLGYGYSYGCNAENVGEGFTRNGDTLEAASGSYCTSNRLKLKYGDWKLVLTNITYGKPVVQTLKPDIYLTGKVTNADSTPTTVTVQRAVTSTRTVSHTTTSSWTKTSDLGISVAFEPLGTSLDYSFSYETSTTQEDSNSKEDTRSFQISSQKTLSPHSVAEWKIVLTKQRVTVPYTATVTAMFSTEFSGYLKCCSGNFHSKYRGSYFKTKYEYRFGNDKIPMYDDLREKCSKNMAPWLWNEINQKHKNFLASVEWVTNKDMYSFPLTGQFEDVLGTHADIEWRSGSSIASRQEEGISPEVPKVFPHPPRVDLSIKKAPLREIEISEEEI